MNRTQQIKEAHPWLSYNDAVKVILYHHQGSMWIKNLERDRLQRSMEAFTKLVKSKSREESFERRWNRARAILLKSK